MFNVPGRRIVHLTGHGLTNQSHGNLFGALALTLSHTTSASDDGFLSLAEIYNRDMRGCELTILSVCDTNYGPRQKSEGVWTLSHGFLVAGSRQGVASNWYVDDSSARSLISYFCSSIAMAKGKSNNADRARSLRKAKKWVRAKRSGPAPAIG